MIEESWLSVILEVMPESEAKERAAFKAIALYEQKSSGKVEGSLGDCLASGVNKNLAPWWGPRAQLDNETGCVS